MRLTRRHMIAGSAAGLLLPAAALAVDPQSSRSIGSAKAPVTVTEFFSLTCTHCAAFMRETFPTIKSKLIDTGKVHWVFSDFPLDQIALKAAMVARSLPPDLYEPFVVALYQSQMQWAFNSNLDPTQGLKQEALLAGMPGSQYDKIIADTGLQNFVMQERTDSSNKYNIDATPSFRAQGPTGKTAQTSGEMSYDAFVQFISQVS